MQKFKRIVTAIDNHGKSIIADETMPDPSYQPEDTPGLSVTRLWATQSFPVDIFEEHDLSKPFAHIQKPGFTQFVILTVPPLKDLLDHLKSIGKPVKDVKKFRLHRTNSIDYAVILSGEITLLVGDEEVILKAGDCVVQRGTEHAWHNHNNVPCIIAAVGLTAKTPDTDKANLLEEAYDPKSA